MAAGGGGGLVGTPTTTRAPRWAHNQVGGVRDGRDACGHHRMAAGGGGGYACTPTTTRTPRWAHSPRASGCRAGARELVLGCNGKKKVEKMPHPSLCTYYSALYTDYSAHYSMDALDLPVLLLSMTLEGRAGSKPGGQPPTDKPKMVELAWFGTLEPGGRACGAREWRLQRACFWQSLCAV